MKTTPHDYVTIHDHAVHNVDRCRRVSQTLRTTSCTMLQLQRPTPSLLRSTTSNASSAHEAAAHAVPELQNLTAQDIDIVDAVIERAGSSATTFFSVFKAYSEVLKERGLDPQEVVYYGKLLKLGTLKGKNWGEKWEVVKEQLGRVSCCLCV